MRISARRPAALAASALAASAVAVLSLALTACADDGNGTRDAGAGATAPAFGTPETTAPKKSVTAGSTVGEEGTAGGDTSASDTSDAGTSGSGISGSGTSGSSPSGSSAERTARSGAKPDAKSGAKSGAAQGSTPRSKSAAVVSRAGSKKHVTGTVPACTVDDLRMTARKNAEPPYSYLELTARNTSGHKCRLVEHPEVTFGDFHTSEPVPAVAKSRPEVPVVLEPGAPAYASIKINFGGVDEESVVREEFNVMVFAADGGPQEGADVVSVPGGFQVDQKHAKTGYWTYELRNGADEF